MNIRGTIEVGGLTMIGGGALIAIADNAVLKFGKSCYLSNRSKVFCEKSIVLGDNVRVSWECQIFDSNFHYMSFNGNIKPKEGTVVLESNCWIGNRVTIQKNTYLPQWSVVASNSLINKNFSTNGSGGLYAGSPAKLLSQNCSRIFGYENEQVLYSLFSSGLQEVDMNFLNESLRNNITDI